MKIIFEEPKKESFWDVTKAQLAQQTSLDVFKNWDVVRAIPVYNDQEFPEQYAHEVTQLILALPEEEQQKWCNVLKEPFLGHTEESYNKTTMTIMDGVECSSWTLKSVHHLLTFQAMSGRSIFDYEQIVDFGAGIGETARVVRDLTLQTPTSRLQHYYVYDLPEMSRISQYYLGGWATHVTHYKEIPNRNNTLFVGTWSLSEVPFEYRDEIVGYFNYCDYLIIFQNQVFDYQNQQYFINQFPYVSNTFYRLKQIPWHPGGNGNFYMVALNKETTIS